MDVAEQIMLNVVFRNEKLAHLKSLRHHAVDFGSTDTCSLNTASYETAEQEDHDNGYDGSYENEKGCR